MVGTRDGADSRRVTHRPASVRVAVVDNGNLMLVAEAR